MNALKTILYMGSMHGVFTFYVPYVLSSPPTGGKAVFLQFTAILLWGLGAYIIAHCSIQIIRRGRGTPAHFSPPRELVIVGFYRHVRNPIYLGSLIAQSGFVIWAFSFYLAAYVFVFLFIYQTLIIFFEEPLLKRNFGQVYMAYCRNVRRWIPKRKPYL